MQCTLNMTKNAKSGIHHIPCPNKSQHESLWHSQHLFRWPNIIITWNHAAPPPLLSQQLYKIWREKERRGMWITLTNKKNLFPWHVKIGLSQKRWTYGYTCLTISNSVTCCEAPNETVFVLFLLLYTLIKHCKYALWCELSHETNQYCQRQKYTKGKKEKSNCIHQTARQST